MMKQSIFRVLLKPMAHRLMGSESPKKKY
jgi:hypothetical protein